MFLDTTANHNDNFQRNDRISHRMVVTGETYEDVQNAIKKYGKAALIPTKAEDIMQYPSRRSIRGEQPDSPALPADCAMRGDYPLSLDERSEE